MTSNTPAARPTSPWWFDYNTAEMVRKSDGRRWRVEDVTPLHVRGEVDVAAVDRWVLEQPEDT
jgi:hypothetical protein